MVITLVSQQFNLAGGVGGWLDADTAELLLKEGSLDAGGSIDVPIQRAGPIIAFMSLTVTRLRSPLQAMTMKCLVYGRVSAEALAADHAVIDIGPRAPVEIRGVDRSGYPLSHGKAGVASIRQTMEFALNPQGTAWLLLEPGQHTVYIQGARTAWSRVDVADPPADQPVVVALRAD